MTEHNGTSWLQVLVRHRLSQNWFPIILPIADPTLRIPMRFTQTEASHTAHVVRECGHEAQIERHWPDGRVDIEA